jgi:hypothetical protein
MSRPKQWLLWVAVALAATALLAVAAAGWKYRAVSQQPFSPSTPVVVLSPVDGIKLGDPVAATVLLALPWHLRPDALGVTPGEGTQMIGTPTVRRDRIRWGRHDWRLTATIQPYRDGETGPGKLDFRLEPTSAAPGTLSAAIPAFAVASAETGGLAEPQLAGRLSPDWRDRLHDLLALPWHWLALLVAVAGVLGFGIFLLLYRYFRGRFAPPPPPPPWDVALRRLCELRTELVAGAVAAEAALQRLSDVVRAYLEARFSLHAPRQTTAEFLRDLERADSPLADADRAFLKDFLTAADLVKFARQPADVPAISDAVARAERLVSGTIPAPAGAPPDRRG